MADTTRDLICITCPRGCSLHVTLRDGVVLSVSGNACPRGAAYAESECTHPTRTLTSTVPKAGGGVLSVKTDRPIPKELLFKAMTEANQTVAKKGTKIGDVLLEHIAGTDASLVATENDR